MIFHLEKNWYREISNTDLLAVISMCCEQTNITCRDFSFKSVNETSYMKIHGKRKDIIRFKRLFVSTLGHEITNIE